MKFGQVWENCTALWKTVYECNKRWLYFLCMFFEDPPFFWWSYLGKRIWSAHFHLE